MENTAFNSYEPPLQQVYTFLERRPLERPDTRECKQNVMKYTAALARSKLAQMNLQFRKINFSADERN